MDVMSGTLRGMGSSLTPMLICVIGVCVLRLVWIWTVFSMEQFHTLQWLMVAWPLSWIATFTALLVSFFIIRKKREKKAVSN
jgi:Na+-driven multidrug efflux pump